MVCYDFVLVVFIARCFTREAPPQTGVVNAAGHAWEAGSGENHPARARSWGEASDRILVKAVIFFFQSQALMSIKARPAKANDGLSSALLIVFLDSARNLPVSLSDWPLHIETFFLQHTTDFNHKLMSFPTLMLFYRSSFTSFFLLSRKHLKETSGLNVLALACKICSS